MTTSLKRLSGQVSWQDSADEYRAMARQSGDLMVQWGYIQMAQYCQQMADRIERRAASKDHHGTEARHHPNVLS